MLFERRYKTQDYFRYFFHLFSVPSFIFSINGRGLILTYPQRIVYIIYYQRMVSLIVILFNTKYFLYVYMYIDLLKLKAYKLFENSDADLSWLLFLKKSTCEYCDRDIKTLKCTLRNCYNWFV